MSATTTDLMEWNGEPVGTPFSWYAFVPYRESEDAYLIDKGPTFKLDSCGELTYAECDYGGLVGLVAFDGHIQTRAAFEAAGYDWPHGREFDDWYAGKWRQMTTDEAVALGLVGAG